MRIDFEEVGAMHSVVHVYPCFLSFSLKADPQKSDQLKINDKLVWYSMEYPQLSETRRLPAGGGYSGGVLRSLGGDGKDWYGGAIIDGGPINKVKIRKE